MLVANPLTHFPTLSSPPKFKPFTNSFSLSFPFHRRYSSTNLLVCGDFLSGKNPICRKLGFMAERVIRISALGSRDGEEIVSTFEQEPLVEGSSEIRSNSVSTDLEAILNRLSKWLVAVLFGAVILWRHDAEALWAAMGSVINTALSVILKRILNQERPVSNLRSDPGMPSSHAQSIFFSVIFVLLSMVEWLGVNELTLFLAALSLVFGSYLSWLRVVQQLHTTSQVVVGAVLGSCFSLLWFWAWDALVVNAFDSFLWVRVSVVLGSLICCLGFLSYVILYWFNDER